jgi:hypothetical protein
MPTIAITHEGHCQCLYQEPPGSDRQHEARKVPASPVRQPTLPRLLLLRLRAHRRRRAAHAEPGHDERGVAALAHLGDAAAWAHGPGVHPVQRARGVGALGQHGGPERVHGPDLEREPAAGRAGEQAHQHPVLLRARAVEPPVHVRVQQAARTVRVAALQRAVQLLHHRLAARRLCLRAVATDDGALGRRSGRRLGRAIRVCMRRVS